MFVFFVVEEPQPAQPLLVLRTMLDRQALGRAGEDAACRELQRRGYQILERRYRTRHGELDVICRHGHTLVFVEVKARVGRTFGSALEAVTPFKQRRIAAMAADYLARRHVPAGPCRFDVVGIAYDDDGRVAEIAVVPGAFAAG